MTILNNNKLYEKDFLHEIRFKEENLLIIEYLNDYDIEF